MGAAAFSVDMARRQVASARAECIRRNVDAYVQLELDCALGAVERALARLQPSPAPAACMADVPVFHS